MGKYSKKNLRGNWQEEDMQNALRVVRTSKLSTKAATVNYKVLRRTLREYLAENKQSKSKLGSKLYFHHSRRKSYPRKLLG